MLRTHPCRNLPHAGPILVACLCIPGLVAAQTETVSIPAIKDNTLYEDSQGALSNGQGGDLFAGVTGFTTGFERRRALVMFDVAGNVPAGATIRGVQLALTMTRTISGDMVVRVHRVLASWGEGTSVASGQGGGGAAAASGDATWRHRFFNTTFWNTPGGDFAATPSAQSTVGSDLGVYTWESTQNIVDDVQAWLDQPASNAGWILIGEEGSGASSKRFASRENPRADQRPVLLVTYMATAVSESTWGAIKGLYR